MSITSVLNRLGQQGVRLVLLVLVIAATGVGLGLAAGYPVSKIQFEESDAVRLSQQTLVDKVDPAAAVTALTDLPEGWEAGDPAIASFGLLGSKFCGETVELPTTLSSITSTVHSNPSDESVLISQAVRVDRWQSARQYVDDVGDAVGECDRFYKTGIDGERVEVRVAEAPGDAPITDHVSRKFVSSDGTSVQVWSLMAIGDVIVATQYVGPTGPQQGLLSDAEMDILRRVAPEAFAVGGIPTETTSTTVPGTETTVLDSGTEDQSPVEGETPPD
ncbi:MAG: hypothetical protein ACYC2O_04630 [Microthrixaceae bacterium]